MSLLLDSADRYREPGNDGKGVDKGQTDRSQAIRHTVVLSAISRLSTGWSNSLHSSHSLLSAAEFGTITTKCASPFDRSQSPGYQRTDAAPSTIDHVALEIPLTDFATEEEE